MHGILVPQVRVPGPIMSFQPPAGGPNHVNDQQQKNVKLLQMMQRRVVSANHVGLLENQLGLLETKKGCSLCDVLRKGKSLV